MVMSVARRAMTMRMIAAGRGMTTAVPMIVSVFVLCVLGHDLLSYHFK